jgi:hypothetical protein
MERYERKEAIVLERRYSALLGLLGTALPLVAMRLFGRALSGPVLIVLFVASMAAMGLSLVAFLRWPRRRVAHVIAEARGLALDGRLVRLHSLLRNGFATVLPDGSSAVRLEDRWGFLAVNLLVTDPGEAESMLRALRLDLAHSTATFWAVDGGLKRHVWRAIAGMLAWLVVCVAEIVLWDVLLHTRVPTWAMGQLWIFVPYVVLFARYNVPITVGSDGVLIRRYLGKNRYIPYAQIERVDVSGNDVVLKLRSGQTLLWGMGLRKATGNEYKGDALVRRIQMGIESRGTGQAASQPLTLIARGERSVHEWVAGLMEIADAARATYRLPTVPLDQFWRLVEDASYAPDVRAGAAVALRASLDDEGKERLRVATETCASPRLRVAFDAIRRGSDGAELEEALEAAASAEAPARRRG